MLANPWRALPSRSPEPSGQTEPYYYDGHWAYFRYLDELAYDIASEQLPAISIAIAGPDADESPGQSSSLPMGSLLLPGSRNRLPVAPLRR